MLQNQRWVDFGDFGDFLQGLSGGVLLNAECILNDPLNSSCDRPRLVIA